MLVDRIIKYGRILSSYGDSNTPIDIVEGLLDTWEILKVKQALASRGFDGKFDLPLNKEIALANIKENSKNSENEIDLILNTICYIEFRNPILSGVKSKFVIYK